MCSYSACGAAPPPFDVPCLPFAYEQHTTPRFALDGSFVPALATKRLIARLGYFASHVLADEPRESPMRVSPRCLPKLTAFRARWLFCASVGRKPNSTVGSFMPFTGLADVPRESPMRVSLRRWLLLYEPSSAVSAWSGAHAHRVRSCYQRPMLVASAPCA